MAVAVTASMAIAVTRMTERSPDRGEWGEEKQVSPASQVAPVLPIASRCRASCSPLWLKHLLAE
eukprot:2052659-Pyramimonas_sp.AAC.1